MKGEVTAPFRAVSFYIDEFLNLYTLQYFRQRLRK